ncbi:MAG: hypothetical protein IKC65_07755, partial [Lentisphaeria bacterium]|nr:hypothetical protein [Lentisphaeria bacterium]
RKEPITMFSSGKAFVLALNTYSGRLYLSGNAPGTINSWGMSLETGKFNMASALFDGAEQKLIFNGITFSGKSRALFPAGKNRWTLGFDKCDFTVTSIRIANLTK